MKKVLLLAICFLMTAVFAFGITLQPGQDVEPVSIGEIKALYN